ncbi:hypothetical protein SCB49_06117 [unidentified eubacterium SCB49]|nr:hypothetical protein SCB49_06117 [unidentified eubacterium SCB49]
MKPNFLIIGSPKCGTTSLYYYLNEHPEVFLPEQKELHFFTNKILSKQTTGKYDIETKRFHIKDITAYKSLYKAASSKHIAIGEASPSYINHPEIIGDIKSTLSEDTKIIIMLRDPIKRAYSNYLHMLREGRETLPFFDALTVEDERAQQGYSDFWLYRFNSEYFEKVDAYKKAFKDVLIINFEAFFKDTSNQLKKVYTFLDIDSDFEPNNTETAFNPGGVYKKNIVTKLVFEQSKTKDFLKKVIPLNSVVKRLKIKIFDAFKKPTPKITPEASRFLEDKLKEDVLKLKNEYDFDISLWNEKLQ